MELYKEITIEATDAIVWDVLVNPKYIEKWLGVKVECDWKVDSSMEFKFSWDGKDFIDKGTIIAFKKNKVFAYSYWSNFSGLPDKPENYSKIKFETEWDGLQSLLKLTHSEIKNKSMYEHSDNNWKETLSQIKDIAESMISDD